MSAEHGHGFAVDADGAGPAAFGGALDTLAADDGSRPAESHLGGVEVHGAPAEIQEFATSCAGVGSEPVEGKEPVRPRGGKE
jgi:hypothetical protein